MLEEFGKTPSTLETMCSFSFFPQNGSLCYIFLFSARSCLKLFTPTVLYQIQPICLSFKKTGNIDDVNLPSHRLFFLADKSSQCYINSCSSNASTKGPG